MARRSTRSASASSSDATPSPSGPQTIVVGLVGIKQDAAKNKWQPTIHMAQHFLAKRATPSHFYLLHQKDHRKLANALKDEIAQISPKTMVELVEVNLGDPWDFESVFKELYGFVESHSFYEHDESVQRFVHLTTGTDVFKACWAMLTFRRMFRGKLLQSVPDDSKTPIREIDPDLESYASIANLFKDAEVEGEATLKQGVEARNVAYNNMIKNLYSLAAKAGKNEPILLLGDTGVGKTVLAEKIYEFLKAQGRFANKDAQFQSINCAALPQNIVESTLFGAVKGAYTGSGEDRRGYLNSTNGGVLFLDEIGDLDLRVQATLLTAIDGHKFKRVGSVKDEDTDYHLLICGTNQDLRKMVAEEKFRADLLARIDMFSYTIPSLADRRDDIVPLLEHMLNKWSEEHQQCNVDFAVAAKKRFLQFAESPQESSWNANLRDLKKIVHRLAMFAEDGIITKSTVEREIEKLKDEWKPPQKTTASDPNYQRLVALLGEEAVAQIDEFDLVQLLRVVEVCRESKTCEAAASRLRNGAPKMGDWLRKHLKTYNLTFKQIALGDESRWTHDDNKAALRRPTNPCNLTIRRLP